MIKYILWIVFIASVGAITSGFIIKPHEWSEQLIGFGTVGLFIIVIPLFSYHRWKNRNLKDYMLTKENIDKMRENEDL